MLELLLAHVLLAALDDVRLDVARTGQQAARLASLAIVGFGAAARRRPRGRAAGVAGARAVVAARGAAACVSSGAAARRPAADCCGRGRRRGDALARVRARPRARGSPQLGLRATAFLAAGRLAAFLPLADFGAVSWPASITPQQQRPLEERAIIPADPGAVQAIRPHLARASDGAGLPEDLWCAAANLRLAAASS